MRLGLIADVHANWHALQAVLEALDGVDRILCAGDLTGYYTRPNQVVRELVERGVFFVAGNHDVYLKQPPANANELLRKSIEFTRAAISLACGKALAARPCQGRVEADGVRVGVFHGSPWDPQEEYIYPDYGRWERFGEVDADLIVLGHTHRPMMRRVAGRLIINPGSCGQPREGDSRASAAIVETRSMEVMFLKVPYEIDVVVRELRGLGLDERLASLLVRG